MMLLLQVCFLLVLIHWEAEAEPVAIDIDAKQVTVEDFSQAESHKYMSKFVRFGAFGKFFHTRRPASVERQPVVRMNQDTLYSCAILDLDASPANITFPESKDRYVTLHRLSEYMDSFPHVYEPGLYTITREQIGTRYAVILLRIFMAENNETDIKVANALQDRFQISQADVGTWEVPSWSTADLSSLRKDFLDLFARTTTPLSEMYGVRGDLDRLSFNMGVAAGWGANQARDSIFFAPYPKKNNGLTTYTLRFSDVPLDYTRHGWWSVTVYNSTGFMEANSRHINSYNRKTAKHDADAGFTIFFGDCEEPARMSGNCIPIMRGWNYCVLLYVPLPALLNGSWKFPNAVEDAATDARMQEF